MNDKPRVIRNKEELYNVQYIRTKTIKIQFNEALSPLFIRKENGKYVVFTEKNEQQVSLFNSAECNTLYEAKQTVISYMDSIEESIKRLESLRNDITGNLGYENISSGVEQNFKRRRVFDIILIIAIIGILGVIAYALVK